MDLLSEGKEWPTQAVEAADAAVRDIRDTDAADAADAAGAVRAVRAAIDAASAVRDAKAACVAAAAAVHVARARQATALAGGDPILSRRRQRDTLLKLIKEAPITPHANGISLKPLRKSLSDWLQKVLPKRRFSKQSTNWENN
jgi:hypothetical protein